MKLLLVGLLMTNGISFSPSEEDDREYSPEKLYSYIVFANNYVEKTEESLTGQDKSDYGWNPNSKHKDILTYETTMFGLR